MSQLYRILGIPWNFDDLVAKKLKELSEGKRVVIPLRITGGDVGGVAYSFNPNEKIWSYDITASYGKRRILFKKYTGLADESESHSQCNIGKKVLKKALGCAINIGQELELQGIEITINGKTIANCSSFLTFEKPAHPTASLQ